MFGGAGGRGSRVSVASLEGLRNVLRNETERDSAPVSRAAPLRTESPAPAPPPVVPADDKQTLRGLNDRLSGYLDKVKQLQEENQELEKQIDDILAKRKAPEGRDWDKIQEPLDELKNQVCTKKKKVSLVFLFCIHLFVVFLNAFLFIFSDERHHHRQRKAAASD